MTIQARWMLCSITRMKERCCEILGGVQERISCLYSCCYRLYSIFFGYGLKIMPAIAASKTITLWGISQECTSEITNPENSIDGPESGFDGKTAACALGGGAKTPAWTINHFERLHKGKFDEARIEIGFYVSGWSEEDILSIQASNDGGKEWIDVEMFDRTHLAPNKLTYLEVDANDVFRSQEDMRKAQNSLYIRRTDPK